MAHGQSQSISTVEGLTHHAFAFHTSSAPAIDLTLVGQVGVGCALEFGRFAAALAGSTVAVANLQEAKRRAFKKGHTAWEP
jgi:hypothetical protein